LQRCDANRFDVLFRSYSGDLLECALEMKAAETGPAAQFIQCDRRIGIFPDVFADRFDACAVGIFIGPRSRPTPEACPQTVALRIGGRLIETHILAKRLAAWARRAAVHAGG